MNKTMDMTDGNIEDDDNGDTDVDHNAVFGAQAKADLTSAASGGLGGSASAIFRVLREKGASAQGMTAEAIREQFKVRDSKETRKRIRLACDSAVTKGDCVYTPYVEGKRNVVRYIIVPQEIASQLDPEILKDMAESAKDFRFDGGPIDRKGRFITA